MENFPDEYQQQYARFKALLDLSHQRYLEAGGNPHRTHSGLPGEDFLTPAEREELIRLGHKIFGIRVVGNQVECGMRSWPLSPPSES
ncbi:MAG: hypothetical protein J7641_01310 [Cyanobacteria bacterium SID2]|nr:hypothetical protein [Cyanobacteria bacterium SID2]MBP0005748.1 hypothetical protein [Cyanobacteria bacterium SBC]